MEVVIENLTKSYGEQNAVDDISFKVKTGEVLGFLGPNGAGKTTTMKMLTSYIAPSKGQVFIGGHNVQEEGEQAKKLIGYLPEHNPLYLDMGIIDYLEFVALLQGVPKAEVNQRILQMIDKCGLGDEKHKKIGEISKGYRQRVGLAQAMIHDPQVLILDEPTTGLDPNQIVEIRKLIKELGREKTVILSTHILPEVESTCDRILIISRGKIVADGTSASLRSQAQGQEVVKVTIEDGPANEIFSALQALSSIEQVDFFESNTNRFEIKSKTDLSSKREIFKLCVSKKWTLTEMTALETKLEDIFRNLTLN